MELDQKDIDFRKEWRTTNARRFHLYLKAIHDRHQAGIKSNAVLDDTADLMELHKDLQSLERLCRQAIRTLSPSKHDEQCD